MKFYYDDEGKREIPKRKMDPAYQGLAFIERKNAGWPALRVVCEGCATSIAPK